MALATAIAAAATIGGAVLSSKSQKKAANQASQTATDNTAANNALARDIYGQNKQVLAPYVATGNNASNAINALLGIGGAANANQPQSQSPLAASGASSQGYDLAVEPWQWRGALEGGASYGYNPTDTFVQTAAVPATATAATANPQQQYQDAFANYRNSTGYQFRLGEGLRALDASASARGVRNSGAAARSLANFGQGIASSEFGNYLNALQGQQGVGLSAAGAQAGVSTNFVNQTTANNNAAASAAANAALAKGTANGQMWGGIASGIGGLFGSSFGR